MLETFPALRSLNLAAALSGLSVAVFRHALCDTHLVDFGPDGMAGRWYVGRASLEEAIGRSFSLEEVQNADKSLRPRREQAKSYRRAIKLQGKRNTGMNNMETT